MIKKEALASRMSFLFPNPFQLKGFLQIPPDCNGTCQHLISQLDKKNVDASLIILATNLP